jgi:hypothetical protein
MSPSTKKKVTFIRYQSVKPEVYLDNSTRTQHETYVISSGPSQNNVISYSVRTGNQSGRPQLLVTQSTVEWSSRAPSSILPCWPEGIQAVKVAFDSQAFGCPRGVLGINWCILLSMVESVPRHFNSTGVDERNAHATRCVPRATLIKQLSCVARLTAFVTVV